MTESPSPDQLVDAVMARSLQLDAANAHVLFGWIVMGDPPGYPGKFVGRLVTDHPTVYVLVADPLAELQAMLPPDLARSLRQPADPAEVGEIWFSG
jgi:hypothetical protein